jgi:hypothetical protein
MKFRLRFSVRTLAIVVTLACAYLAAWKATMKYGLSTPYEIRYITNATGGRFTVRGPASESSPMPFIIRRHGYMDSYIVRPGPKPTPRYYLWLFGPKIKVYGDSHWKEI